MARAGSHLHHVRQSSPRAVATDDHTTPSSASPLVRSACRPILEGAHYPFQYSDVRLFFWDKNGLGSDGVLTSIIAILAYFPGDVKPSDQQTLPHCLHFVQPIVFHSSDPIPIASEFREYTRVDYNVSCALP
ncbi:hypothetical protein ACTXT7_000774 [Hymenolepis weldensis]